MSNTESAPATAGVPALPDYLKDVAKVPSSDTDALAAASVSIPRISLKAKQFRFMVSGEEVRKEKEKLQMVILAVDPGPGKMIKTFYKGRYSAGDSTPPTCSSQDGIRPDMWASEPQSEMCATCPMNRFGSATSDSGKKTKACRDAKRLWLADPKDIGGTVYGMNVPVTSLKSLSEFGRKIQELNVPLAVAIVEFTMDEDESYPILYFKLAGWLDAEAGKAAMERNAQRNWEGGQRIESMAQLGHVKQEALASPQLPVGTPATTAKSGDVDAALKNW